jgi:hypothetical protein
MQQRKANLSVFPFTHGGLYKGVGSHSRFTYSPYHAFGTYYRPRMVRTAISKGNAKMSMNFNCLVIKYDQQL